ncbi:ATP-dependent RNA helicase DDX51 [Polyodon spathula]|uniref:ATP-dependent RNA helicase DDX51 n=1 Tax=Polyodon spathula TaxID=7913 RepID=UPI001B7DB784|nr:ATP-dependent RNA helicase DDX51 [Polyodon spathula]
MALFLINRYLGDEEDAQEDAAESRSKTLLERLQERAKARQQQQHSQETTPGRKTRADTEPDLSDKTGKKKKKRKLGAHETEEEEDGSKRSRKKKIKSLRVCLDTPEQTEKQVRKGDVDSAGETDQTGKRVTVKKKEKRKEKEATKSQRTEVEEENETEQDDSIKELAEEKKTPANKRRNEQESDDQNVEMDTDGEEEDEEGGGSDEEEKSEEKEEKKEERTPDQSAKKVPPQSTLTILGGFEKKTVQKVQRVLPQWLAQPNLVQRDIKKNLVPIGDVPGICPKLLTKLQSNGIQHFFPVQAELIPAILESAVHGLLIGKGGYRPRDICVSAPTGSGKTLAFVIPVVQALLERVICEVRVLAVLPTKELAQQVCKVFHTYTDGTSLKVVMVAGQKSFAVEQASLVQNTTGGCRSLADIVVATPGRLVDHIDKTPGFSLRQLRYLIIDEADRMIDGMHQDWLNYVVKEVYRAQGSLELGSLFRRAEPGPVTAASLWQPQMPLQKLMFSATLTQNPEKLQQLGLHQPRLFTSVHSEKQRSGQGFQPHRTASGQTEEKFNFPQGLTEYYVPCSLSNKPLIILHFLLRLKFNPVLCFTNSREASHRLYLLVRSYGGVAAAEFSSRLSPSERKKTLKEFEQGKIQLLISTDATARGIDVDGVKCVINYDAPQFIRTYVHRVGRTARAGKAGLAFTLLLGVQEKNFLQMLRDAGSPGVQKQLIRYENLKPLIPQYENALEELQSIIKEERAMKYT